MMICLPPKNSHSVMLPSKSHGNDALEIHTFTTYDYIHGLYVAYVPDKTTVMYIYIPRLFTHHTNKPMSESVILLPQTFKEFRLRTILA